MTTQEMLHIVQSQLATDLNCLPDDLNGKKITSFSLKESPGRRPFPRSERHFEMLTMGMALVVSASPDILEIVKPLLDGKTRDEAFSMPFVYGQSLYYLPDLQQIKPINPPNEFDYEIVEQTYIPVLYQFDGFHNAIQYDVNHPRPDILVVLARKNGKIVGMAGASADCAKMWQIGMDVLPEHRNNGLAAYLVNNLTLGILERGYIPYYGTSSANIASQRTAHRAGYVLRRGSALIKAISANRNAHRRVEGGFSMNNLIHDAYELLKDGKFDYAVCGGFAIELFLNKTIRKHGDIDISAFWSGRDKIILHMQSLGRSVYELCGGGMAHRITDITKQIKSKRNIFCMTDDCTI